MRPVIIAANWKMNTTPADAGELARAIARRTREPDVVRVICPPYVCLAAVRDAVAGEGIGVGAQNLHQELAGAYTGEVSAPMLAGLAGWVILGHSERRRDAGETDALIGKKLGRAVDAGLRPILCVGEQLAARVGDRRAVVEGQSGGALVATSGHAQEAGLVKPTSPLGMGRRNARRSVGHGDGSGRPRAAGWCVARTRSRPLRWQLHEANSRVPGRAAIDGASSGVL